MHALLEVFRASGAFETWYVVAYIVCMFNVATFKSEQIRSRADFRRSYYMFAAFLVVPALLNVLIHYFTFDESQSPLRATGAMGAANTVLLIQIVALLGKALFALSIMYALKSLIFPGELETDFSEKLDSDVAGQTE